MLTVIADAARLALGHLIKSIVEGASARMTMTLTQLALISLSLACRLPWPIVEERQTLLTVGAHGVVLTLALALHHAILFHIVLDTLNRYTLTGVSITQAAASQHHLIKRIIILFLEVLPRVKQVVSKRVQLGEIYSQISNLE